MGMYGYPIDEEDFKKDAMEEASDNESEEDVEIEEDVSEEDACVCEEEEDDEDGVEYYTDKKGRKKIKRKKITKEQAIQEAKDYTMCAKPGFFEDMMKYLSPEHYALLRKDFYAYIIINVITYSLGMAILYINAKMFNNLLLLQAVACLVCFSNMMITAFWKGKLWCYVLKLRHDKHSNKKIAKVVTKVLNEEESIPLRKSSILGYILIVAIVAYVLGQNMFVKNEDYSKFSNGTQNIMELQETLTLHESKDSGILASTTS